MVKCQTWLAWNKRDDFGLQVGLKVTLTSNVRRIRSITGIDHFNLTCPQHHWLGAGITWYRPLLTTGIFAGRNPGNLLFFQGLSTLMRTWRVRSRKHLVLELWVVGSSTENSCEKPENEWDGCGHLWEIMFEHRKFHGTLVLTPILFEKGLPSGELT